MQQRIGWIDSLKFFAIFLVIWGHSVQQLVSINESENPVFRFIYSFHMPLFMALSGFFIAKGLQKPWHNFLWDKFRQLILPCISLGIIFLIIRKLSKWGGVDSEYWFMNFHPEQEYWFLKSAFLCSLVYFVISKCGKLFVPILILTLILSQCFFLNGNFYNGTHIATMFPSFVLGVTIQKHFEWFKSYSDKIMIYSGILFVGMSFFYSEWFYKLIYFHDEITGRITFENSIALIFQQGYKLIIGLMGVTFLIALFENLSHKVENNKITVLIEKWGTFTLGIYLLQTIILENILVRMVNFDYFNFNIFNFIITPLISVIVLFLCIIIVEILNKSDWLRFFFLGSKMAWRKNSLENSPNSAIL